MQNPQTSDKFDSSDFAVQWQWHSNVDSSWWSLVDNPGSLRLNAARLPEDYTNLWDVGSMVMQKLPAPRFSVTTRLIPQLHTGEKAGLLIMGKKYACIGILQSDTGLVISQHRCTSAESGGAETKVWGPGKMDPDVPVYLRVAVSPGGRCNFSYSLDGISYTAVGSTFTSDEGKWIGAKVGLFCHRPFENTGDPGYADYEWFNVDHYYNRLPLAAKNPVPEDTDTVIAGPDFTLAWEGDMVFTDSFYVYLDTEPDPQTRMAVRKTYSFKPGELERGQTYYWRVDAKNDLGITGGPVWSFTVDQAEGIQSLDEWPGYKLEQNHPNSFSESTTISFTIPKPAAVKLKVYTVGGSLAAVITDHFFEAGTHSLPFMRKSLAPGVYLLRMEVEDKMLIRKMVIR